MNFNIIKLFLRNMVLCKYQCYAREGVTQGVCGDFCQMPLPRDMSKCNTLTAFYPILPFCFKSHSSWATSCVLKKIPTIMIS